VLLLCVYQFVIVVYEQLIQSPTPDLFSGPVNIKWQEGGPAPVKDHNYTAVLHDGKVYIGGGHDTINIYTPANNSWSPSPINHPYKYFAITTLNNQLITAGGMDKSNKVTNKIFSLDSDQLKEYTRMITPRYWPTATGYQGTLLITGGRDDNYKKLATTELYHSATSQWYNTSDLPSPNIGIQPVIVDNVLYLLGGPQGSTKVFTTPLDGLTSHQLKWSTQQDTPSLWTTPVSIKGKHLLTIGGVKGSVVTRNIYMFNKVSYSWEVIGQIPSARSGSAVVSIANNKIVVIGGCDDKRQYTNTVWIGSCEPQ